MSKIALLIPVYNDQDGLNKTLISLERETKECIDVVVVDDGSKEKITVPNHIGCHKIIYIRSSENRGIEYVLNMGLEYIRKNNYEFTARIDAGDTILKDRFYKQISCLKNNPEYMLIGSHVKHVDLNDKEVFIEYVPILSSIIERKMHINSCFPHPSVMFRTKVLDLIGVYSVGSLK